MIKLLKNSIKWSSGIAVITLVLAAIFSVVSTFLLGGVSWAVGMLIVLVIVLTGVVFDIIGVAATAVKEKPFHAMAAKRVHGSKQSIFITRNADRVANFCNDVVGDISGIVSGTASAAVVLELTVQLGYGEESAFQYVVAVLFTSVVAALTVGGKAFGKAFAIKYATEIILQVGRIFYFVEDSLKIKFTYAKKKKSPKLKEKGSERR
ncbi:MAG TPA: hypothetical protein VFT51_16160 [Bacillales bacterium]|nr:hypothetical protein [Bacillales bacterium]